MTMVLIRMLTSISGIGIELSEGDSELFPIEDAKRFVDRGLAEPANDEAAAALAPAAEPEVEQADDAGAAAATDAEAKAKADADAAAAAEAEAKARADTDAAAAAAAAVPAFPDLSAARKAYHAAFDKGPGPRWTIEEIAAKIAAKPA